MSYIDRNRRNAKRAKRTAIHVKCGMTAADRHKLRGAAAMNDYDRFCGRLPIGPSAYASAEEAAAAVDLLSAATKLPPPTIFHIEGEALFAVWRLTHSVAPAQWAETAAKLERLARHHGLRLDGFITRELPFDFDAVVAGTSASRRPQTGAADCLSLRLPIGPGGYPHETAAVEALEGFTRDRAEAAGLGRPLTVGPGDAIYGVWRFAPPVPTGTWLVMAELLQTLARGYGLKLDGPPTSEVPFDLDSLIPGTLAETAP